MANKTPLAPYIANLYKLIGGRYWHGMCGEIGSGYWWDLNSNRTATAKWYKNHPEEKALGIGVPVSDCCGVDKAGRWMQSDGSIKRDSSTDFNEEMLKNECIRLGLPHGKITTLDRNKAGLILKNGGHMAVTVGNGKYIESRGSGYAIKIYDMSKELPFTEWYTNPFIDYKEDIMKIGDKGVAVHDYQTVMKALGYNIGAFADMYDKKTPNGCDGSFGNAMVTATKEAQSRYKLPVTGMVDAALYGKLAIALLSVSPEANKKIKLLEADYRELDQALRTANSKLDNLSDKHKEEISRINTSHAEVLTEITKQSNEAVAKLNEIKTAYAKFTSLL